MCRFLPPLPAAASNFEKTHRRSDYRSPAASSSLAVVWEFYWMEQGLFPSKYVQVWDGSLASILQMSPHSSLCSLSAVQKLVNVLSLRCHLETCVHYVLGHQPKLLRIFLKEKKKEYKRLLKRCLLLCCYQEKFIASTQKAFMTKVGSSGYSCMRSFLLFRQISPPPLSQFSVY